MKLLRPDPLLPLRTVLSRFFINGSRRQKAGRRLSSSARTIGKRNQ
ncbi:MAG: hypothetical protein SGI83_02430 [Bacteroidota bacterium]|nr:hypothetical protein [Bacteroidota bacterium]